jgi:Cu-Zn family superoxide dismutase
MRIILMIRLASTALITLLTVVPVVAQEAGHSAADHSTQLDASGGITADLSDGEGNPRGQVTAVSTPSGYMHLTIELMDVPQGVYGAHLHESGLCEGPDFTSAGGHLARDGEEHGILSENGPHIGDLPNIHVPESKAITVEYFVPELTREMLEDENGTAFMLHAKEDDLVSQPSGDAGGRMVCGVIYAPEMPQ